jgi:hypothetical protein
MSLYEANSALIKISPSLTFILGQLLLNFLRPESNICVRLVPNCVDNSRGWLANVKTRLKVLNKENPSSLLVLNISVEKKVFNIDAGPIP